MGKEGQRRRASLQDLISFCSWGERGEKKEGRKHIFFSLVPSLQGEKKKKRICKKRRREGGESTGPFSDDVPRERRGLGRTPSPFGKEKRGTGSKTGKTCSSHQDTTGGGKRGGGKNPPSLSSGKRKKNITTKGEGRGGRHPLLPARARLGERGGGRDGTSPRLRREKKTTSDGRGPK